MGSLCGGEGSNVTVPGSIGEDDGVQVAPSTGAVKFCYLTLPGVPGAGGEVEGSGFGCVGTFGVEGNFTSVAVHDVLPLCRYRVSLLVWVGVVNCWDGSLEGAFFFWVCANSGRCGGVVC